MVLVPLPVLVRSDGLSPHAAEEDPKNSIESVIMGESDVLHVVAVAVVVVVAVAVVAVAVVAVVVVAGALFVAGCFPVCALEEEQPGLPPEPAPALLPLRPLKVDPSALVATAGRGGGVEDRRR